MGRFTLIGLKFGFHSGKAVFFDVENGTRQLCTENRKNNRAIEAADAGENIGHPSQINIRDPRTCANLIPAWGWILGFYVIKIIVVRQVCACILRFEREDKQAHNTPRCAKIVNTFVLRLFFACVVGKKPEDPWAPWLTTPLHRWYRRFGISGVYLWHPWQLPKWLWLNQCLLLQQGTWHIVSTFSRMIWSQALHAYQHHSKTSNDVKKNAPNSKKMWLFIYDLWGWQEYLRFPVFIN